MKRTEKTELPGSGSADDVSAQSPDKAPAAVTQVNSAESAYTDGVLLHLVISGWKRKMYRVQSVNVQEMLRTAADHSPGPE